MGEAAASGPSNPPPGGSFSAGAAPAAQPYTQPTAGGMTDNVAGALCYVLGLITGIVFLVLAPYNQNKFVRFHAFQSIFFHVAFIGIWIVETIIAMMMPFGLSMIMSLIGLLISLAALGAWIFLIVKAYQGEKFKLPVVGDLADKQA
jgi:uncharacterized membrane protein